MKVNILVLVIVLFPAAYNNANLGGLHGSRGNSGNPSDLLLITPSGGINTVYYQINYYYNPSAEIVFDIIFFVS